MAEQTSYTADLYRSPYLQQAVAAGQRDPISRWVRYFCRRAIAEAAETLDALATLAGPAGGDEDLQPSDSPAALWDELEETDLADPLATPPLDSRLQTWLDASLQRFAHAVASRRHAAPPRVSCWPILVAFPGRCAWNCLRRPTKQAEKSRGWSKCRRWASLGSTPPCAGEAATARTTLVALRRQAQTERDLVQQRPLSATASSSSSAGTTARPQETILQNEFFTVRIDPYTGAIRSISDDHSRGPRLAQQLALRLPSQAADDGDDAAYSIMAADEVRVASAGPVLGEVVVRGRLMSRVGRRLAGFQQTTRVWRGSRVIELRIELEPDEMPGPDPWNSYYAARFAWPDETARLYRGVNMAIVPTELERLESPHCIDIRPAKTRITLLTGGLPYHRRVGGRKLDTLLLVAGESCRSFRLGIGVGLPHPHACGARFSRPADDACDRCPVRGRLGLAFPSRRAERGGNALGSGRPAVFACGSWRPRERASA